MMIHNIISIICYYDCFGFMDVLWMSHHVCIICCSEYQFIDKYISQFLWMESENWILLSLYSLACLFLCVFIPLTSCTIQQFIRRSVKIIQYLLFKYYIYLSTLVLPSLKSFRSVSCLQPYEVTSIEIIIYTDERKASWLVSSWVWSSNSLLAFSHNAHDEIPSVTGPN